MAHTVITIARQYGSGGKTVGRMLSEDLGIHFYNREILRLASDASGISEEIFGANDEVIKKSILQRIAKKINIGDVLPPDSDDFLSTTNLFNYQAKVIRQLAETESCVIVGRCADYILRDKADCLKVFIHASMEYRADRIVREYGERAETPEQRLKDKDKRRAAYHRFYTDMKWGHSQNYHITLDSGVLGIDKCGDIIKQLY